MCVCGNRKAVQALNDTLPDLPIVYRYHPAGSGKKCPPPEVEGVTYQPMTKYPLMRALDEASFVISVSSSALVEVGAKMMVMSVCLSLFYRVASHRVYIAGVGAGNSRGSSGLASLGLARGVPVVGAGAADSSRAGLPPEPDRVFRKSCLLDVSDRAFIEGDVCCKLAHGLVFSCCCSSSEWLAAGASRKSRAVLRSTIYSTQTCST